MEAFGFIIIFFECATRRHTPRKVRPFRVYGQPTRGLLNVWVDASRDSPIILVRAEARVYHLWDMVQIVTGY